MFTSILQVVLNVGLGIALFDVTSLGDSYIFPGDGASHTRVTFRYVVFRPFMEEILEGVIKAADADGMQGKNYCTVLNWCSVIFMVNHIQSILINTVLYYLFLKGW